MKTAVTISDSLPETFKDWKESKRQIYESKLPFKNEFEAWLNGYVEGMAKAAEIESTQHTGKGRKRKE